MHSLGLLLSFVVLSAYSIHTALAAYKFDSSCNSEQIRLINDAMRNIRDMLATVQDTWSDQSSEVRFLKHLIFENPGIVSPVDYPYYRAGQALKGARETSVFSFSRRRSVKTIIACDLDRFKEPLGAPNAGQWVLKRNDRDSTHYWHDYKYDIALSVPQGFIYNNEHDPFILACAGEHRGRRVSSWTLPHSKGSIPGEKVLPDYLQLCPQYLQRLASAPAKIWNDVPIQNLPKMNDKYDHLSRMRVPIDKSGFLLEHVLIHELMHTHHGGYAIDMPDCYGWANVKRLSRTQGYVNSDSHAHYAVCIWLLKKHGIRCRVNGKFEKVSN